MSETEFSIRKIVEEWEKDSGIGPAVGEEVRRTPKLHSKYWTILLKVRRSLITARRTLEDVELERTLYFTGKAPEEKYREEPLRVNVQKSEVPLWLKADNRVREARRKVEDLSDLKTVLEEVVSQINSRDWKLREIGADERFKMGSR